MRIGFVLGFIGLIWASTASAQSARTGWEYSLYTGYQDAAHGRVRGTGGVVDGDDMLIDWIGKSFAAPPYYGLRATYWGGRNWGLGLDLNHAKVYAPDAERVAAGYDRLEMTDGLNLVTLNGYYRWPDALGALTPYLGAGVGVAVPHVDVTKAGVRTFGYQVTGPVVTLIGGVRYPLGERMAVFAEYKGSASRNTMKLSDGGRLRADVVTNALNIGISYAF